ncbi:MAG: hypothetical protein H8K04_10010 [Nitrospira sp.]
MSEMKDQPIAVLRTAVPVGEISNLSLVDSINVARELVSGMPWNLLNCIDRKRSKRFCGGKVAASGFGMERKAA